MIYFIRSKIWLLVQIQLYVPIGLFYIYDVQFKWCLSLGYRISFLYSKSIENRKNVKLKLSIDARKRVEVDLGEIFLESEENSTQLNRIICFVSSTLLLFGFIVSIIIYRNCKSFYIVHTVIAKTGTDNKAKIKNRRWILQ